MSWSVYQHKNSKSVHERFISANLIVANRGGCSILGSGLCLTEGWVCSQSGGRSSAHSRRLSEEIALPSYRGRENSGEWGGERWASSTRRTGFYRSAESRSQVMKKKKQRPRMLKVQKQEMFLFFSWVICQSLVPPTELPEVSACRDPVWPRHQRCRLHLTLLLCFLWFFVFVFFFFSFEEWKLLKTAEEKSTKVKAEKVLLKY